MIGIACLTALEFTNTVTRIALEWADDENPRTQNQGIRLLRWAGNENTMLRACYERPRQFTNLAALVISKENTLNQSEARTIFFRVTGKPFNAVRPPSLYSREGRWDMFDEMTWDFDDAQGGTSVAGRVRGLSLTSSRMDCRIHSQAGLAYLEWTFEFANQSTRQREARTQILLPVDGVVSRLTLWVNGEEREAAFAGRAEVREAYEKIVRQRRDPVLVTTSGPDRVLMQCFPVPPNGGTMKTRLGITIPLSMLNQVNGKLQLPRMIERNFNLAHDLEHAVWIESRSELASSLSALTNGSKVEGDSRLQTLHGQLIDSELLSNQASIQIARPETPSTVWSPGLSDTDVVIQKLETAPRFTPDRLVIVVDGSKGMAPYYGKIAQALESFPSNIELHFLHASDMQADHDPRTAAVAPVTSSEFSTELASFPSGGGQDNLRWLIRGWDIAAGGNQGAVLWIHGPQPVSVSSDQALRQRIERSPQSPRLFEMQTITGPNRLLEEIGALNIHTIPRFDSLDQDLKKWFEDLVKPEGNWVFNREQKSINENDPRNAFPEVTDHVRRLWAAAAIEELASNRDSKAAVRLAQQQQLVSSVSGAVVLETKEQFENAGLEPVDVGTVPVIPEPSTWMLLGLGLFCLWARGFRSSARKDHI
ncbi:MAG: PEP-CTERM sorting domain-containing protein [Verrucomicrobia bacterium]|nr:PEP-CTERM sorting domain-containing protein [Verrucomicrobiota bacterium]